MAVTPLTPRPVLSVTHTLSLPGSTVWLWSVDWSVSPPLSFGNRCSPPWVEGRDGLPSALFPLPSSLSHAAGSVLFVLLSRWARPILWAPQSSVLGWQVDGQIMIMGSICHRTVGNMGKWNPSD